MTQPALTSPAVMQRFVKLMLVLIVVGAIFWIGWEYLSPGEPGDYEVREGDIQLSGGEYEAAIVSFDAALEAQPNHRGALLGKAAALIAMERYPDAIAVLDHAIAYLGETVDREADPTGRGALYAAYANRGVVHDRQGRHRQAFDDYIAAIKTDPELADEGPGWLEHLLYYDREPSSVMKRARYLHEQFQKPEAERVLRMPEIDERQRMYKP